MEKDIIKKFIEIMKEKSKFIFYEFAGFKKINLDNYDKINEELPFDKDDIVIRDLRGSDNFYRISKKINIFQIDTGKGYSDEAPLLNRFLWLVELFIDRKEICTSSVIKYWGTLNKVNEAYEKERKELKNDPYLALYWILHFGFTLDKRIEEVKETVKEYKLDLKINFINTSITFFDETDENFTFDIAGDESLFLQRRSFLLFSTYLYQNNANEKNFEFWWKSIIISPNYKKLHLSKIYWLKQNLDKFYKWYEFNSLTNGKKVSVSFISYINIFNPNIEDSEDYIDIFLKELKENKKTIEKEDYQFIIHMLWEIRDYVNDKKLLKKVLDIYYLDDFTSNNISLASKYFEINKVIKDKNSKPKKINKKLLKPNIKRFIDGMEMEVSYNFCEFAGCEQIFVSDSEVLGNNISLDSGDWIVRDIRCNSGTYGISHDSGEIYPVKLISKFNKNQKNKEKMVEVINKNIFKNYTDKEFLTLLSSFEKLTDSNIEEEEAESLMEKYNEILEQFISGNISGDMIDENFQQFVEEFKQTYEEIDAEEDFIYVIAQALAIYIYQNHNSDQELKEVIKIISNLEVIVDQEDVSFNIYEISTDTSDSLEFIKMKTLFKLKEDDKAYQCVRKVESDSDEYGQSDIFLYFEDIIDSEEYKDWLENTLVFHDSNENTASNKKVVDAEGLMYRYYWMWELIVDGYKHRVKPNPYTNWGKIENLNNDYEEEKKEFKNDPYLALYWLLHFGFSLDKRFDEVKQIVKEYNLSSKLDFIKTTIEFFEETDENFTFELKVDNDLFLKRRAFLVFITQSYEYRGGEDNFDLWWKSITIYSKCEGYSLRRVRWLRNNLLKFNKWNEFDSLKNENKENIDLISYVYVCDPNTKNKEKYADIFLEELKKNKKILIKNDIKFAQRMIWDIRNFVTNKELLNEITEYYFKGDTLEDEYKDIKKVLGENNSNFDKCKEISKKLCNITKNFKTTKIKEEKLKLLKKIDLILSQVKPEVIYQSAINFDQKKSDEKVIMRRCFHYIFTHDLPNKKDVLITLYNLIGDSKEKFKEKIFFEEYPNIIKDEDDPNLEIVMELVINEENGFLGWSKEATMFFFKNIGHLPKVFNFFIEVFNNPKFDDKYTKYHIVNEIFMDKEIEKRLSKEQIETLLNSYIDFLIENANADYSDNLSQTIMEVRSSIGFIENTLAKEWFEQRHNNKKWLLQFKDMKIFIDDDETMSDEINEELERGLQSLRI